MKINGLGIFGMKQEVKQRRRIFFTILISLEKWFSRSIISKKQTILLEDFEKI